MFPSNQFLFLGIYLRKVRKLNLVTAKISKTKSFVFRVLFFSKFAVYFCGCLQANVSDPVFITSLLLLSEPAKEEHSNPKGWNGCNARIVKGDRFYGAICLVDTYDDCSSSTFNDIVTDTQRLDFVFNLDIHELAYPECKAPIFVLRNIYSGIGTHVFFCQPYLFRNRLESNCDFILFFLRQSTLG